jgi:hypothetical protein
MNRKKQILRQRGDEVAKAGRMFFDAVFGKDQKSFFQEKGAELERELAQRGSIDVVGEVVEDKANKRR